MLRPFLARKMNRLFREQSAERLPSELVEYAGTVINGLHVALREQTEPPYHRPEHPVDGWGLTSTPLTQRGTIAGIPAVALLGHRSIYLSTEPNVMLRVLTAPHPRKLLEEQVIQVRGTSVPDLLEEAPSLYYGLLNAADESIVEFNLNFDIPEPPLPSNFS